MGDFRRTQSKVWWPSYLEDEEEDADDANTPHLSPSSLSVLNWRRGGRGVVMDSSDRGSSSSPSSGSHRSQDSGFSDSESSPSSGSSKSDVTIATNASSSYEQHQNVSPAVEKTDVNNVNSSRIEYIKHVSNNCKLPETTPVKSYLQRSRNRKTMSNGNNVPGLDRKNENASELSKCGGSISNYLAECYFPIYELKNVPEEASAEQLQQKIETNRSLPDISENTSISNCSGSSVSYSGTESSSNTSAENRTCFIVDELPKRSVTFQTELENSQNNNNDDEDVNKNFEERPIDVFSRNNPLKTSVKDRVRFIEHGRIKPDFTISDIKKEPKLILPPIVHSTSEKSLTFLTNKYKLNKDLNESRCSSLDSISLIPPNHTSTPKKEKDAPKFLNRQIANRCTTTDPEEKPSTHDIRPFDPPLNYWLKELRFRYEPECMTTLQSKTISNGSSIRNSPLASFTPDSINIFYEKTKVISMEFSKLYRKINRCIFEQIGPLLQSLVGHVMEFIINYAIILPKSDYDINEDLILLMGLCDRLRLTINCFAFNQALLDDINMLAETFSCFVSNLLSQQIKMLVSMLDNSTSETSLLSVLSNITSISSNIPHVGELIAYSDGIRLLLSICIQPHTSDVKKSAMRTLAAVCCNAESVRQLEKAGGIEMLSEMLSDLTKPESELLEIISVLVQITAPWVEDNQSIQGLSNHLHSFINSLTYIISTTSSSESLLLTAAALANITFLEPQAVWTLLEADTIGCLLTAVRKLDVDVSVFLQEQTATLIANMASVPETRAHLAKHRAVVALLCFLQVKHTPLKTVSEIEAADRLQHKSAIALSRLCSDVEVSRQVVDLNGVKWLVRLCKDERERNYRDDILVACLASLRKIAANCGKSVIEELNAEELIEPRFVDSYLLYSSRQESYV